MLANVLVNSNDIVEERHEPGCFVFLGLLVGVAVFIRWSGVCLSMLVVIVIIRILLYHLLDRTFRLNSRVAFVGSVSMVMSGNDAFSVVQLYPERVVFGQVIIGHESIDDRAVFPRDIYAAFQPKGYETCMQDDM